MIIYYKFGSKRYFQNNQNKAKAKESTFFAGLHFQTGRQYYSNHIKAEPGLRRDPECVFVSLFGLVLPAWLCVQTVRESERENDIITECVRVNHEIVCWMNNKPASR